MELEDLEVSEVVVMEDLVDLEVSRNQNNQFLQKQFTSFLHL